MNELIKNLKKQLINISTQIKQQSTQYAFHQIVKLWSWVYRKIKLLHGIMLIILMILKYLVPPSLQMLQHVHLQIPPCLLLEVLKIQTLNLLSTSLQKEKYNQFMMFLRKLAQEFLMLLFLLMEPEFIEQVGMALFITMIQLIHGLNQYSTKTKLQANKFLE